eukprot:scaffold224049_cov32-Tisochrysis_lutea.AAC.1
MTAAPSETPAKAMGLPPKTSFQKLWRYSRLASTLTVLALLVSAKPQPRTSSAYASTPRCSSSGINRRNSRHDESNPWRTTSGGASPSAFVDTFVFTNVALTGPLASDEGSVSGADSIFSSITSVAGSASSASRSPCTYGGMAMRSWRVVMRGTVTPTAPRPPAIPHALERSSTQLDTIEKRRSFFFSPPLALSPDFY